MAELLRRILWLVPVLIAGSIVVFGAFGTSSPISNTLSRPLFYNPTPNSAQLAARRALDAVKRGDAGAAARLSELGGAALPVVLQELPTLTVKQQRAVTRGLEKVAARMHLRGDVKWASSAFETDDGHFNSDSALLFWERYREEHALDLRPLATSRLVKRAAQRDAQLQNSDLLAIDTYALPTLVESLGRVGSLEDLRRARRLVSAISHASGRSFAIPDEATVADARRVLTDVREFWDETGPQWTQLGRSELLVARFSQTEFASWVFRTVRQLVGMDHPSSWYRIVERGTRSAWLLAFCLLGLLVIGPSIAATIQVASLRRSRWQLERWSLRGALAAGLLFLTPFLAGPGPNNWVRLSLLGVLTGTAFSAFVLHRELNDRLDWRTHHVLRARPGPQKIGAVFRWLAPSVPTLTPLAVTEAALWVTCLEASTSTPGLGSLALQAYAQGDLDFLMTFCLGLGLATGLAQILADFLLGSPQIHQGEW